MNQFTERVTGFRRIEEAEAFAAAKSRAPGVEARAIVECTAEGSQPIVVITFGLPSGGSNVVD